MLLLRRIRFLNIVGPDVAHRGPRTDMTTSALYLYAIAGDIGRSIHFKTVMLMTQKLVSW